MKLTVFLAVAILSLSGSPTGVNAINKTYCLLHLPPPADWIPGLDLFPVRVAEGFNRNYSELSLEGIIQYAQESCNNNGGCTSLIVVSGTFPVPKHGTKRHVRLTATSAIPSGDNYNPRTWFGYLFTGPPVTITNFTEFQCSQKSFNYPQTPGPLPTELTNQFFGFKQTEFQCSQKSLTIPKSPTPGAPEPSTLNPPNAVRIRSRIPIRVTRVQNEAAYL
ncbi:hypothetical protein PAAG_05201 [Paracoccidioides lutzii Pb01]|uniref:Uncharacterized protein n=1 Tax=Paracoccidioides lutzii (strain ATCC MYA-826 / Pb01) TaxID=502779 RepID=C1H358_PARBA|nr:hypothetical protein PAAG_05201 [Paracoccidioides lutzii Pb01]EEH34152.2 hypothetical protein PAAG_05201 [Paracoccidioides lutzii Pb01]